MTDLEKGWPLYTFLAHLPPEERAPLLRFLPEGERRAMEAFPPLPVEGEEGEFSRATLFEEIHWSWFLKIVEGMPAKQRPLFLNVLSRHGAEQLAKTLALSSRAPVVSELARSFLRDWLVTQVLEGRAPPLPVAYLPPSPLHPLLSLSKGEILSLIDQLALHDLAAELRQIVETKILKKLYSFLSGEEKSRLKELASHKESSPFPRLGLEKWSGTKESLKTLLHRRGLARLGVALSDEHPDFAWYVCHQLDVGRGTLLWNLASQQEPGEIARQMRAQIEALLTRK